MKRRVVKVRAFNALTTRRRDQKVILSKSRALKNTPKARKEGPKRGRPKISFDYGLLKVGTAAKVCMKDDKRAYSRERAAKSLFLDKHPERVIFHRTNFKTGAVWAHRAA